MKEKLTNLSLKQKLFLIFTLIVWIVCSVFLFSRNIFISYDAMLFMSVYSVVAFIVLLLKKHYKCGVVVGIVGFIYFMLYNLITYISLL